LMLPHPLVALRPGVALFHVNSLLGQLTSPGAKLLFARSRLRPRANSKSKD
jgi:hypothetical protein